MNSLSTNKTLWLLDGLLCLPALLGCVAAWAQIPGHPAVNPHPAIVAPRQDQDDRASSANLPKLALTPQLLYQMLLAEIAGARSNLPLAARTYLDAAKSTRDPRIARRATEFALYARQPEQALDAARIWVEADGESAQARQMLAGLLLNAQQTDQAAIHLAKLLTLDPANLAEALTHLNRLLGRFSDKAAILKLTEQLTAPYLGMAEAHWARAQAAANASEDKRALQAIDQALTLRPDWEQAVLFKSQVQQRSSNAQALETLSRFSADHPKAREVRFAYARALLSDKNYEGSRREFTRLMEENPDDPEVLYAVGLLSLQLNDLPPAEKHLKRLLDLGTSDPNPLRYYLGQIAENAKRPEDAMQWYVLVTRGEQFMPARSRIAALLLQQGRLDEARRSLQQAATGANLPENERVTLLIAESQLLRDAGRIVEAFEVLSQGLAERPEQPDLLYEAALLAEKLGKIEVLETNLRKLIRLKPDYAHAYNALGYSLADRGERLDEAQRLIEKALELAPEDPFILDSKGWLLYRRGDRNGSYTFLNRALSLRPDPEIAAHLGEVLWAMGRREEALKTWNDAVKVNPTNELLPATIKKFAQ